MELLGIFGLDWLFDSGTDFLFFYLLLLLILPVIAYWKIFEKAGQPGWAAIIPLYNLYIFLKVIGKSAFWIVLLLLPFINIIFMLIALNLLSKSFGKDESFTFGLIILYPIFLLVLAFGSSDYIGPIGNEEFRRKQYQNSNNQTPINVTVNTPVNVPHPTISASPPSNTISKPMFCTSCGAKVSNPNARFCVKCGTTLS
jgi:hypothetical protein